MSSPNTPRASVGFDPGIGSGAGKEISPAAQAMLDRMSQAKKDEHVAQATAAVPEMPVAAPAQPAARVAPLVDEYRDRNPSLPRMKFEGLNHLPSAGLAYPPGTEIRYRPYTLGESLYAEESKLDMRGTYALILKGVEVTGMDAYDLTLPDVLFLGLVRKIASLPGTKVTVTTTCPFCQGLNQTSVECTELEFNELKVPALPLRVPFSFGEHSFRPLTLRAYLDLLDADKEDDFVALIAAQCITEVPLAERMEMINSLTDPDDIALVKQIDQMLHHELAPIQIVCPQELSEQEGDEPGLTCGKRYPVALDDVSAAFVLPFSDRKGGLRRQIAFGPAGDRPS